MWNRFYWKERPFFKEPAPSLKANTLRPWWERAFACRQREPGSVPTVINFEVLVLELITGACWRAGTIYLPDHP